MPTAGQSRLRSSAIYPLKISSNEKILVNIEDFTRFVEALSELIWKDTFSLIGLCAVHVTFCDST